MELKYPDEGLSAYTYLTYKSEKENGTYPGAEGSFCRTFMEALDRELNKCTGTYHQYVSTNVKDMFVDGMEILDNITGHDRGKNGPQYNDMKQRCYKMNMDFRRCRENINKEMVKFLFENDGVIDRWPYVENFLSITIGSEIYENLEKTTFHFAYFGDNYKPSGYKVYRDEEGAVYKHDFSNPYETEELKAIKAIEHEKHVQFFSHKARTGKKGAMKRFKVLLPAIIAALFLAFSLLCYFKDIVPAVQVKEWFQGFSGALAIVMFLPKIILYIVAYISEILRLNDILFWVGTLGISLAGIITGIKKVTSPNLRPVSKEVLDKMWEENTDALEKRWEEEKKIKEVSNGWNTAYFNYVKYGRDKYGV